MSFIKPLIDLCVDGEEHSWLRVAVEPYADPEIDELTADGSETGARLEHRWCEKCGSLAQVLYRGERPAVAAVNENGRPHLAVPEVIQGLLK